MKKLNTEQGVSFVFSTHDERLLKQVNQVVELHDGILTGFPAAQKVAAHLNLTGARQ